MHSSNEDIEAILSIYTRSIEQGDLEKVEAILAAAESNAELARKLEESDMALICLCQKDIDPVYEIVKKNMGILVPSPHAGLSKRGSALAIQKTYGSRKGTGHELVPYVPRSSELVSLTLSPVWLVMTYISQWLLRKKKPVLAIAMFIVLFCTMIPFHSSKVRVAFIVDSVGISDMGYNASAIDAKERMQKEWGLDEHDITLASSTNPSNYQRDFRYIAGQNYNVIVVVGDEMDEMLKDDVPDFRNVKFVLVDGEVPGKLTNCTMLDFKVEQGSFLAGFLAASVSKSKKVGFVGGKEIAHIKRFEAGYRAGVKAAGYDPDIHVLSTYTGDWNDEAKGRKCAKHMLEEGVDVIFHAAGGSGIGVLKEVAEENKDGRDCYAIGVDQDQSNIAIGCVLTSVIKHVDTAVFENVGRVRNNQFIPGTQWYDLKNGGIGLFGLSETGFKSDGLPIKVQLRLQETQMSKRLTLLKKMIEDGKLIPPTTLEQLKGFHPILPAFVNPSHGFKPGTFRL